MNQIWLLRSHSFTTVKKNSSTSENQASENHFDLNKSVLMSIAELLQDESHYGNSSWCESCYYQTVPIVRNSVERPNSCEKHLTKNKKNTFCFGQKY